MGRRERACGRRQATQSHVLVYIVHSLSTSIFFYHSAPQEGSGVVHKYIVHRLILELPCEFLKFGVSSAATGMIDIAPLHFFLYACSTVFTTE